MSDATHQLDGRVTALHLAAVQPVPEIVAALVAAGARKNVKNQDGRTPLEVAAKHGHPDLFLPHVGAQ